MPRSGEPILPGERRVHQQQPRVQKPQQAVRQEWARNKQYRAMFAAAVEARDVQEVLRIGRAISSFAHGTDHCLWDDYYNAVRLTWSPPGEGYTMRAITPRAQTSDASRHHIPQYENAHDYHSS